MELLKFILIAFSVGCISIGSDACTISINGDLPEPQPLLLHSQGKHGFVYPSPFGKGNIELAPGESIQLACPGGRLSKDAVEPYNLALVECVNNKTFSLVEEKVISQFNNITCDKYPQSEVRTTGTACGKGISGEIGFSVESSRGKTFHNLIDFCHDANISHTIYAHSKISAEIGAFQAGFGRPVFSQGNYSKGLSMFEIFKKKNQIQVIASILNSTELAEKFIHEEGDYWFSKGHLIAKGDFIYGSQQRATFYYVNVVPMWQNINSGNWVKIENTARNYARDKNRTLDVWTGSLGVLQAEDVDGILRDIYLYRNKNGKIAVPVPKLLFKVVYDSIDKAGIVFITVNNPHLTKLTNDLTICEDVCEQIPYVNVHKQKKLKKSKKTNNNVTTVSSEPSEALNTLRKFEKGYTYCCRVEDFRKSFSNLPEFITTKLLV